MSSNAAKGTLMGLTLLFLTPLVVAWLMYIGVIDYRPENTRNHGTLIQPPVAARLPESFSRRDLTSHWLLIYPLSPDCGESCEADLIGLRQIGRALGKDADRIRSVLLSDGSLSDARLRELSEIDAGSIVMTDGTGMLRSQLESLGDGRGTFLIDPLGNFMMHYHADTDPNDIRLDLERLLKYAKTDPQ
jgi:hypothetical protein